MKIAMIGLGSMNGAILAGLLDSGVQADDVTATSRSAASAQERSAQYGVQVLAEENQADANTAAVTGADVVFLGVKPYQIIDVCTELKEALNPGAVVVSVAAGVPTDKMEVALQQGQPVIRTMPNTPTSVGEGAIGLAAGTHASAEHVDLVSRLLSPVASVFPVPEDQINIIGAIGGSGPAFAFYLAELMATAAAEEGLDPQMAAEIAAKTLYGAGKMLVTAEEDASQLRANVTSPNGTTERSIAAFDEHGLAAAVRAAVEANIARAKELS